MTRGETAPTLAPGSMDVPLPSPDAPRFPEDLEPLSRRGSSDSERPTRTRIGATPIAENSPLSGLSDARVSRVLENGVSRFFDADTLLFAEGSTGRELYFVESGELEVFRVIEGERLSLFVVGPGQTVGEFAFLDPAPRSASVRTLTDALLVVVTPEDFGNGEEDQATALELSRSIAVQTIARLRETTDARLASQAEALRSSVRQAQFGQIFGYVMASFAIGTIVNASLQEGYLPFGVNTRSFSWFYLFLLLAPAFVALRRMRIPLADVGLTLERARHSLTSGLVAGVVFSAVLVVAVVGLRDARILPPSEVAEFPYSDAPLYLLHTALQELLARGLMQSSFQRLFDDERGTKSVLLSTLLFALVHVHFGLHAVALVGVTSVLFGFFHLRHRSLLGVTLFHFIAGLAAFRLGLF